MRHLSWLISLGVLAATVAALQAGGGASHPGLPAWAVLTFAVAAFSGPMR